MSTLRTVRSKDGTTLAYDVVAGQLAQAIPAAALVRLAGQDHMPRPEALLPVLTRSLETRPEHGQPA
jgi:hypothetical protein